VRRIDVADAAGIINGEGRENDSAFREMVADSLPEVRQLALAVRELVYEVCSGTVEVVWPKQRSVGWGIGPKKFSEQFGYLMSHQHHVTLGFYHGGELSDPGGLLPKKGGKQVSGKLSMRSLRITRAEDVQQPALRSLIEAAVKRQIEIIGGHPG
jgi:hypothetical protein